MIASIKIITALAWLIILANIVMPFGGQLETMLNYSGIGLLIAHAIEVLVYLPLIKKAPRNKAAHALQVLVFGVGHFLLLKREADKQ